jgi:hypothetical protein
MSNSTSRAFKSTVKTNENLSTPSVKDYLVEICKEDNVDVNEYLAKHNETRTIDVRKPFRNTLRSHQINSIFNPSMEYTWKNKLEAVWVQIKSLRYTSYNLFDFNSYKKVDGNFEFFCYSKVSTPWDRFKRFIKTQYKELKWAWKYTPDHIVHFNKNKPRINWFEEKVKSIFFLNWDDNKDQTIKELKEKGYQVSDNRIWHEPIPLDDDKRII